MPPKKAPDDGEKDAMSKIRRRFVELMDPILDEEVLSAEANTDVESFRLEHGVSDFWFNRFLEDEFDSSKAIYEKSLHPDVQKEAKKIMARIGSLGTDLSGYSRRKKKVQRRENYSLILGGTLADGTVDEDEAFMLQRCQMILGITNVEHAKALGRLGWSEEKFYERAGGVSGEGGARYEPDSLLVVKVFVHQVEHTKKRSKMRQTHRKVICRLEMSDGTRARNGRGKKDIGKRRKSVADEDIKTTMQKKIFQLETPAKVGMDPVFDFPGQLPVPLFESALRDMFLHVELIHDHQNRSKDFETPLGKVVIPVQELMDEIFTEGSNGSINVSSITEMIKHAKKFDFEELQDKEGSGSEQVLFTFVAEQVGKDYLTKRLAVEKDVNTSMMLNEVDNHVQMLGNAFIDTPLTKGQDAELGAQVEGWHEQIMLADMGKELLSEVLPIAISSQCVAGDEDSDSESDSDGDLPPARVRSATMGKPSGRKKSVGTVGLRKASAPNAGTSARKASVSKGKGKSTAAVKRNPRRLSFSAIDEV
jgi:hypothetical protein